MNAEVGSFDWNFSILSFSWLAHSLTFISQSEQKRKLPSNPASQDAACNRANRGRVTFAFSPDYMLLQFCLDRILLAGGFVATQGGGNGNKRL
jgi:hypothetical protein